MRDEILELLEHVELDYSAAASNLGAEALPELMSIVQGDDPRLAARAAYLASRLDVPGRAAVLQAASKNTRAEVRIAAAAGWANLKSVVAYEPRSKGRDAEPLDAREAEPFVYPEIAALLKDADPGVRRAMKRSLEQSKPQSDGAGEPRT
ncbi:MAG: hypothetical protein WD184_08450 [Acidimicrobiia bacterium]